MHQLRSSRVALLALEVGATLAILGAVWVLTAASSSYAIIPLPEMLSSFWDVWASQQFVDDAVPSLLRLAAGFFASTVIGAVAGFVLGLFPVVRVMFYPALSFIRSIPPVALIPVALLVVGLGDQLQISIIVLVCVWPVLLNVADGVAEIDDTMLATARSYQIDGFERFRQVVLPAVAPRLALGMRTSLAFAVLVLVSSEMVAATSGIGYFVFNAQAQYRTDLTWAGVILLGLLGLVLNLVFAALEKRLLHWHFREGGK
ncbi:MAG: ABC transporter permease [Solirubrobacteraceae bacterium]